MKIFGINARIRRIGGTTCHVVGCHAWLCLTYLGTNLCERHWQQHCDAEARAEAERYAETE